MSKHKFMYSSAVVVSLGLLLSGCNQGELKQKTNIPVQQKNGPMNILQSEARSSMTLPYLVQDNVNYVSLQQLASILDFQMRYDKTTEKISIGDNGEEFVFNVGENKAYKSGKVIQLTDPSIVLNNSVYSPASSVIKIFGQDMRFETKADGLVILETTKKVDHLEITDSKQTTNKAMKFGELKILPKSKAHAAISQLDEQWHSHQLATVASSNPEELITMAKRYLGVRYEFGTGPYDKSGTFDCSTFTQYLYGKQGIDLPRTARAQGEKGTQVDRSQLQVGDLMFFYVPGRFKSNETIGHVAIYKGNNEMIHSSPKPEDGVQITDINKAYWQETFMTARRLID